MKNIKEINIKEYLADREIYPTVERQTYGMYTSPLRNEKEPSFKVDYTKNLWYDFGLGKGGSIIDLVMQLEQCTLAEAMAKLENQTSFSFHRQTTPNYNQSSIETTSIKPLQNNNLLNYIRFKRHINIDIAKAFCSEVHYTINGKPFYAIGFQSDAGGWELRNEYFKGGVSPKGIKTIDNNSISCLLFEGFMDMLSYLTMKKTTEPSINMVVLNSVHNIKHAEQFLQKQQTIHCFLDNDNSGKRTLETVKRLGVETIDHSEFYRNYKDINEYLIDSKIKL